MVCLQRKITVRHGGIYSLPEFRELNKSDVDVGLSQLILDALHKGVSPLESMERDSQLKNSWTHLKSKSSDKGIWLSLLIAQGDVMCHQKKQRLQRSIVFVDNFNVSVCGDRVYNQYIVRQCIFWYLFFSWKKKVSGKFPVSVSMENTFSPQWKISTEK